MLTKLHRGVPENDFSVPRIFFFSLMECLYEFNKAGKGFSPHCYIKCPFLGLGASFGQFSSNGISFHHELIFAMGLEF